MGALTSIAVRATALVLIVSTSSAQTDLPSARLQRVPGPVRDAGIYHAASDTWTRKASTASIGADVVYDNTFVSGYYSPLSGDTYIDEGRLPSPTSPTSAVSRPGCSTSYTIDGVQIAYCTDQLNPGPFQVSFYQSHPACGSVVGLTPTATLSIPVPTVVSSSPVCWVVTVDLDASTQAFTMLADGDGSYSGTSNDNLFAWSIASPLPWAQQSMTGPLIAGDPTSASHFDGTRWDAPVNYAESGTGMGTLDQFRNESGPSLPGCHFFGGVPFASFHLELYADACGPICLTACAPVFCFGDGTGTPCPCGNNGVSGNGCANSLFAAGANLGATGNASISNDSVVLTATNTPNASVLFFQGTIQQNAGAGVVFGDGKRCAGGSVTRLGTKLPAGNTSSYPTGADASISVRGGIVAPGTRTYQGWYRNAASFCTSATFNLTNGIELSWAP